KRDNFTTPITNRFYLYTIDLGVGSDKQPITVHVDTGSSDFWVVSIDTQCASSSCFFLGAFDNSTSTTFKNLNLPFDLGYLDQQGVAGVYVTDDVTLPGDVTVKNLQFAVARQTTRNFGVLGLGLITEEAMYYKNLPGVEPYPNLPFQLKNQGFIGKAAYSLYLNGPQTDLGLILFGGIDQAKYEGPLTTRKGYSTLRLGITADTISVNGLDINFDTVVVFDSGYSFSTLPQGVHDAIQKQVQNPDGSINCNQPDDSYFSVHFGDTNIKVPYSSVVFNQNGQCTFTIGVSTGGLNSMATLGDDILRHAYVVYDLEANTIGVAQAKYTDDSDI
ncbi:acid protease, partial [Suhomyces tanzawaensis NRRL Y-17324]